MIKTVVMIFALFIAQLLWADPQADSLLKCLETSGLGQTSGFKLKQVINREGQSPRTFQTECYLTSRAEKLLVKFEEPADMAGVKLLFWDQGKQLWTYFPSTNRIRKMVGASSGQQIGQGGTFRIGDGPEGGIDLLAKAGDDLGINGIGLGENAQSPCEVADLSGIHHDHGQACEGQGGHEQTLVSAGGFEHDQSWGKRLQKGDETGVSLGIVGHAGR